MKRILLSTLILFNFSLLVSHSSFAQAPGKFKYQAVVRDANGTAIQNENVAIRFQIYNALAGGTVVYQEDFTSVSTGDFGVVNLEIGSNPSTGNLATLDWGNSGYYANIQMKPASGGTYTDISDTRSQLVSVPYALYALSAGSTGQPVSITGPNVSGSFPNFTITDANTTYTAGTNISIDGNNQISASFTEVDGSTSNELQELSLSGTTLSIATGGNGSNSVDLSSLIPPGMIVAYGGTTAPAGWVMCDGTSYSTTGNYANLYGAIQFAFGGSGNNFNVPDLRGRFLRGVDGAADRDPDHGTSSNNGVDGNRYAMNLGGNTGNQVGSVQTDQFMSHRHTLNRRGSDSYYPDIQCQYNTTNGNEVGGDSGAQGDTGKIGGNETRPKNAYVNYIIKY